MEVAVKVAARGEHRENRQSPDWFGYALAKHLDIPVAHGADNDPKHITRLKNIIKTWVGNKVLRVDERDDEEGHTRKFIVPGPDAASIRPKDDCVL